METINPPTSEAQSRPRTLECACCGNSARGRQWWNRDTGYSVCAKCVDWQIARGTGAEEIERNYGKRGVHFDLPD